METKNDYEGMSQDELKEEVEKYINGSNLEHRIKQIASHFGKGESKIASILRELEEEGKISVEKRIEKELEK